MIFEDIDTDHNGAISRDEAKVRMDLASNFDEIDKNGNGSLSVDEYTDYHNKGRLVPEEVEIPEPGAAPSDNTLRCYCPGIYCLPVSRNLMAMG